MSFEGHFESALAMKELHDAALDLYEQSGWHGGAPAYEVRARERLGKALEAVKPLFAEKSFLGGMEVR